MSTAAAETTTPPAATPAPAENPGLDASLKALFDTVEETNPAPEERGMSLTEAIASIPEKKDGDPVPEKTDGKEETPVPEKKDEVVADKPIRGRRRPAHVPAVAPTPTPEPAPQAPATAKSEDELAGVNVLPEEKENLELAEFAERNNPAKYAGLTAKTKKFIKAHADYIEAERKTDPDVQFDANNARYQAFLNTNRPTLSVSEVRALDRARAAEDATAQISPQVENLKDEIYRRDAEPEITTNGNNFVREAVNLAAPEAMRELMAKEGVAKAREKFPFEFSVVDEVVTHATNDMEEFMRLTKRNPTTGRPLRTYDPANQQHVRVLNFVNQVCSGFKQNGGKATVVDGKQFLTREEFFNLKEAQRAPYWTFTNEDIVKRAQGTVKAVVTQRLQMEEERLAKLGFKRAAPAAAAAPAPTPSGAPPAPRGSPAVTNQPINEEKPSVLMDLLTGG